MDTFCKSQQYLCHWVLLDQKKIQHSNSEPKSNCAGNDQRRQWLLQPLGLCSVNISSSLLHYLPISILTLTVTHRSWSACSHDAIPTTPGVIVPKTPWGAWHTIHFEAWFNEAVPVYYFSSILWCQAQNQRRKRISSGSISRWGWISHTRQTLQPLPRLNKPPYLKDCHQA